MKNRILLLSALAVLFQSSVLAATRTSANYSITTDTLDAGGGKAASANYSNDGSMGGIGGISTVGAPVETIKHSYIGQLYDVTNIVLAASPTTVNEGATRQI